MPGILNNRRIRIVVDLLGDDPFDLGEFITDEVQLAQPSEDGQALIDRQLLLGDPLAALLAERVTGWATALEVAVQHRRDLVLDLVRRLTSPRRRDTNRRSIRQRSSPIHTAGIRSPASRSARTLASILSVFTRA
jgi:hypothetical protein